MSLSIIKLKALGEWRHARIACTRGCPWLRRKGNSRQRQVKNARRSLLNFPWPRVCFVFRAPTNLLTLAFFHTFPWPFDVPHATAPFGDDSNYNVFPRLSDSPRIWVTSMPRFIRRRIFRINSQVSKHISPEVLSAILHVAFFYFI